LALTLAALEASADNAKIELEVMRIGDATHFEFSGPVEWKYDLKRDGGKGNRVVMHLRDLKPEALNKLRGISDSLIKTINIIEKGTDDAAEIIFQIADKTDFFDYISDQPARLILDFFPKDSDEVALEKRADDRLPEPVEVKLPELRKVSSKRGPATDGRIEIKEIKGILPEGPSLAEQISLGKDFDHGIFDGGDPEFKRFSIKDHEVREDSIIASRANFYLPFPMLELGVPQLEALLAVPPTYEIVAGENRENKEARVLLMMFSKKQRALFLKAAAEFLKEHPRSSYDELIRYMVADAHYDIYRASNSTQDFEQAMNQYLALTEQYPDSPMAPRSLLLMGYSYLYRGDSFGALKSFQTFGRLHPNSKQIDRVRISTAEAYLRLNRFDDAYELFDQIEKTGVTTKGREEAAFRKGDVFFRRKDYDSAIREYQAAIKRFPTASSRFANAWYNIAEAEFTQKMFRKSLDAFRGFLQKFPDHEHGGYAMTRMGELLGILGAPLGRVEGALMENYFRYRATPGAGVARMRLLTSRMPTMKEKELLSALQEIAEITTRYANRPISKKELAAQKEKNEAMAKAEQEADGGGARAEHGGAGEAKNSELQEHGNDSAKAVDAFRLVPKENDESTRRKPELPGIEEFSKVLVADGYTARHEYDQATQELVEFYQKNPQSPNIEKIRTRIVRNISEGIRASIDRGDFLDSLRRYSKNAGGWLKGSERIDVPYNVARSYEHAGVYKEAALNYELCLQRLSEVKGAEAMRERQIFENPPSVDAVRLRMAAVASKDGDFAAAESHLRKIAGRSKQTEGLADNEQIERAEISAQVAEARGQHEVARKYLGELLKVWKGEVRLTSPLHLRLARLEERNRNFKAADGHLAKIIAWRNKENAMVSDDDHANALELRGDTFIKRGRRAEAAKTYRDLLSAYESQRPLASVRYRLGQVLFQDGDLKGAEVVWNELKNTAKNSTDNLWQRLATEQMQGAKWQNEYKKYLNRIPAATDLKRD
jgi:tetratricopeptide (TPR) repeat protein